ncbi:hypothetical protein P7K49_002192 [Saguinus oedipus]|uniref:Uncharacterized protein n=1 Tax=Saguinus oedipus TaxID=9490 RepID=A0ABQ9WGP0_SAGOE|nr:hypothetical protein P7K49_002192 [Saguinus oedipus]
MALLVTNTMGKKPSTWCGRTAQSTLQVDQRDPQSERSAACRVKTKSGALPIPKDRAADIAPSSAPCTEIMWAAAPRLGRQLDLAPKADLEEEIEWLRKGVPTGCPCSRPLTFEPPPSPQSRLTENEVVRPEDLPKGPRPHGVHGAGLQIHEDCAGHVLAACGNGRASARAGVAGSREGGRGRGWGLTGGLVVVHVDALQLQVAVPVVGARGVDAVLITDHLPELQGRPAGPGGPRLSHRGRCAGR